MAEVYALIRESDPTVRYIGWTSRTADKRFREHLTCRNNGTKTALYNWMRKYDDIYPIIVQSDLTDDDARQLEIDTIAKYGIDNLLNISTGGEGSSGFKHTEEHKKEVSKRFKGKPLSEEHKRKISEATKGIKKRPRTEEEKKHLSEVFTGRIVSEETRQKRSAALKGRTYSEETLAKMSAGQKKRFENLEERKKYSQMFTGKPRSEKVSNKMPDIESTFTPLDGEDS